MRLALKFAYDGTAFYGYARQPNLKTVEGSIIEILKEDKYMNNPKESRFQSASRTDKGVSSLGNVVAFNTNHDEKHILQDLNEQFTDMVFYTFKKVKSDFNPRYAQDRWYRYYLPSTNLDVQKMIKTAALFTGTHDFHNFARIEAHKNPIRTIQNIVFILGPTFIIIDFFAQTFLWHQIRRIVSALTKVGQNDLVQEQIIEALNYPSEQIDFGLSSATSLLLMDILYDFEFNCMKAYKIKLEEIEIKIVDSICPWF